MRSDQADDPGLHGELLPEIRCAMADELVHPFAHGAAAQLRDAVLGHHEIHIERCSVTAVPSGSVGTIVDTFPDFAVL